MAPLIHSKTPKAFKANVREMMHHGHPQKQALAAAYHEQRSAQHKKHMDHGGACTCSECYAEGGSVGSWTKREDNEKGVNRTSFQPGVSRAGMHMIAESEGPGEGSLEASKREHKKTLGEMRGMKKPKLMDEGGEVYAAMDPKEDEYKEPITEIDEEPESHSKLFDKISKGYGRHPEMEAEGGEVHGDEAEDKELMDSEIHGLLGEELMAAFDAKDKKRIHESIEAIVLNCLNKE